MYAPPYKGSYFLWQGLSQLTDSGEKVLGKNFMSAINGYAEKSNDIFSSVSTSILSVECANGR